MRSLTLGLLTGLLASAMRAPLGLELVQVTATPAAVSVAYRAVAFLLLAIALLAGRGRAGEGLTPLPFLSGALLGVATHGLFLGYTPKSHMGAVLLTAALGAALWYTARGLLGPEVEAEEPTTPDGEEGAGEVPTATPVAHALIGAGLALALEGVYRHLRLLGAGTSADDSVFATAFLALTLAGAASFRSVVRSTTSKTLCLAGSALGAWASLQLLSGLSTPRGLDRYLRWFDLDTSLHGTFFYDALLASVVLVVPAFLLGAGFQGLHRRSNLAGLSAGAAIGLIISPYCLTPLILNKTFDSPFVAHEFPASQLIPWGAAVAFLGAALHLVRHPGFARWAALSFFVVSPLPFIAQPDAIRILAPWQRRAPQPKLMVDTPQGLFTVEPTEFDVDVVTLDRRLITPTGLDASTDRLQLEAAVGALPKELRDSRDFRVLLLGQLTPKRALALLSLGAGTIDRTASWHDLMPLLEFHLFHSVPRPEGLPLSPGEARAKLREGGYDLVIAPSIRGEQPTTRNFASGPDTVTVVWFDAAGGIAHEALGAEVLLSTATLEDLSVGVVHGVEERRARAGDLLIDAGPRLSRSSPWSLLGMRIHEREQRARAQMARRLGEAESAGVGALLAEGLDLHFNAQAHSSPYETLAERIELSDEALEVWSSAGLSQPTSRAATEILGAAGRVLRGKRAVTRIYDHLEPVVEVHPGWTELVAVLAYADLEALDPSHCIHRIESTLELGFDSPILRVLLSDAMVQLGRAKDAVEQLWIAYEDMPTHDGVRERLAVSLVRAGDAEGKAMIEDLLLEDPDREHLKPYLEIGPLPPVPTGYIPLGSGVGGRDDHEGHGH
ncbi:MAG: hypothetical protein MK291_02700 [Planctomycetes bacterium]|nr:hypothetical protein [Planctomycetota bacterium]